MSDPVKNYTPDQLSKIVIAYERNKEYQRKYREKNAEKLKKYRENYKKK